MKRERFNTTLKKESRKKLKILTATNDFNSENEMIEHMIDIEWGKYINEMGSKKDRERTI